MSRVHCLGILVVDALSGPLVNYPVPRVQTQVITPTVRFLPGGGAANTGSALARLGQSVAIFSKVGNDLHGAYLYQELAAVGANVSGIVRSLTDTTPYTFVGIHTDGDRTFIHTPGANLTFSPDDLSLEQLLDTEYLLYQDCWVLPGLDGAPGAALLAEAQRRGVVTLLDECWGLGPRRDTWELMLPHCDYILPSLDDMQAIYSGMPPEAIADRLLTLGAKTVVLKMGKAGCLVAARDERYTVPPLTAQVVDTTGAGDCWNAGFLAGLLQGECVKTAALLGNACAACCIEAVGGAVGVPSYAAVCRRAHLATQVTGSTA